MAETLRPCPLCGGEAKEFTGEDAAPHRWTVECDSCGAHVGSDTRHRARAKWNRRAEPGEAFVLVAMESVRVPIKDYQLAPGEVARATVDIAEARPVAASSDVHALREAMGEIREMRLPGLREWNIVRVPFVGGDRR